MEYDDLIEIIMFGQSGLQWAKSYRRSRIRLLTSEHTPIALSEGCAFFLHIVPYGDRLPMNFRDDKYLSIIRNHGLTGEFHYSIFNSDGYLLYGIRDSGKISNYLLYMRSGIVEQCIIYKPNAEKSIPGQLMNEFLINNIVGNLETLDEMKQNYPFAVFVTLVGVEGWTIVGSSSSTPIDRNETWIEECDLKEKSDNYKRDLTPILDAVWNCSGVASSPYV